MRRKQCQVKFRKDFWDCYKGVRRSAIVHFFPSLTTVPEVFAKVNSAPKAKKIHLQKKTNEGIELQCI